MATPEQESIAADVAADFDRFFYRYTDDTEDDGDMRLAFRAGALSRHNPDGFDRFVHELSQANADS